MRVSVGSTAVWDAKVYFGIRYYQTIPVTLWSNKRHKEKKSEEHYIIRSTNFT